MTKWNRIGGALAAGVLIVGAGCVAAADLPAGYTSALGNGVASNGLIVGTARRPMPGTPFVQLEAFLLDGDEYTMLGTPTPEGTSEASAVNSSGTVAGSSAASSHHLPEAFVWTEESGMQRLPVNDPATEGARASAINEGGDIVGLAYVPGSSGGGPGTQRAFLHTAAGVTVTLPPLPGSANAAAHDINDAGQVVGWSSGVGVTHAVLWEPPSYDPVALPLPPVTGVADASAFAIDEDGTILGGVFDNAGSRALRWSPGPGHPWAFVEGFWPVDIDGGNIIGTREEGDDRTPVLLEAGATQPEALAGPNGNSVSAIAAGKIVGSTQVDGVWHPARFSPAP